MRVWAPLPPSPPPKARLEFLMFALTNSNLGLSEAHVDLVWRVLVEEALTPEAAGEKKGRAFSRALRSVGTKMSLQAWSGGGGAVTVCT